MGGEGRDDDPVLDAVFMSFMRAGYGGFSMRDVAEAAGVPEHEVTGRGTRGELVVAALVHVVPAIPEVPDTGTLRGDLLEAVNWQIDLVRTYGPVIERSLESTQSEEYATAARKETGYRMQRYWPMFERAIARGEMPALDYECSVDLMLSQVYARYLGGRPLGHEHAEAIIDLVLQGLTVSREQS